MSDEDRNFLAYLFAWSVDVLATAIMNTQESDCYTRVCTKAEILDQAEILVSHFEAKEEPKT